MLRLHLLVTQELFAREKLDVRVGGHVLVEVARDAPEVECDGRADNSA